MRVALLACLLLAGCDSHRGRWVYQEETYCPGGKVNVEKRIVDAYQTGRTRNTTIRTNTCLD